MMHDMHRHGQAKEEARSQYSVLLEGRDQIKQMVFTYFFLNQSKVIGLLTQHIIGKLGNYDRKIINDRNAFEKIIIHNYFMFGQKNKQAGFAFPLVSSSRQSSQITFFFPSSRLPTTLPIKYQIPALFLTEHPYMITIPHLLNNFNQMRENYNPAQSPHKSLQRQNRNTSLQHKDSPKAMLLGSNGLSDQFKKILLPSENIMQAVSIVEWRCQTSMPIVKIAQYVVSPNTQQGSQKLTFRSETPGKNSAKHSPKKNKNSMKIKQFVQSNQDVLEYELKIRPEEIKCRLSQVGILPFSQALHLLKEMLIGFEALFDIFGGFQAKEDLVAVNKMDQWRMWIDSDYCNNTKMETNIKEKEFIYKLIIMTEKHSLQTMQSRNFFGAAKESTYANDCSFIKMLEKLNDFISTNKIYIPSKATIVKAGGKQEDEKLKNTKNNLRNIVTPKFPTRESLFKKRKESCQTFISYNQSAINLSCGLPGQGASKMRSYPSCAELRKETDSFAFGTPPISSLTLTGDRGFSYQAVSDYWNNFQKNQDSAVSLKIHNDSPQVKKEERSLQREKSKKQLLDLHLSRMASPKHGIQSTPAFYLPRPKHAKTIENEGLPKKPVSQLQQPVKRANIRKYSEQLTKLKSADNLLGKKLQASTVCKVFQGPQKEPSQLEKPFPLIKQSASPSESSQGIHLSSPNNSSSTKQINNSGDMQHDSSKPTYRSMKMNDLAPHRKNNQSLISGNFHDSHNKNMTISYQFKRGDAQSDSESQEHLKVPKQQQWVNKISDLFSDTMSIKQLKGSIKFKTKQEEVFQKDFLKDVKLDMLQKFGRSVTLHCQDQGQIHQPKSASKHQQYKSMQLIQEQLQEVKSYQEDQRRDQDITSKSIRSRRQTQDHIFDRQRQISFKDGFMMYHEQGDKGSVFNFQTEMYSIRAHRAI